ncbi:MAG: GNAT family N-acetyltransferase [Hyphomicrobiales bacterium]|nr:GNAT family N-acetyltransferase [Hyphomicrobiales bacterium]
MRPFRRTDAPVIARLANDAEIAKMTASLRYPYPAYDAVRFLRWALKDAGRSDGAFLVTLKSNPRIAVGTAGVHLTRSGPGIGYWMGAKFRRRGYAREAAAAVTRYGFEGLGCAEIEISCRTVNAASRRIIKRLGGGRPKLRPGWSRFYRRKLPTLFYMLTRAQWDHASKRRGAAWVR